jgi:hypothetical protein
MKEFIVLLLCIFYSTINAGKIHIGTIYKKTAAILASGLMTIHLPFQLSSVTDAVAFDNAVPNDFKMPKSKGPAPTNLGFDSKGRLRMCLKPSPNCFSTTPDFLGADGDEDDESPVTPWGDISHTIPLLRFTKGDPTTAYKIIGEALDNYVPGQSDIDGGGFKVMTRDAEKRYYYVQFESLRRGYIDDLEIAVNDDSTVQVVSSSRLGYLDFRVNSKRLNYIFGKLRGVGFIAQEITPKTHPSYFDANQEVVRTKPPADQSFGKKKY